MDVKNGQRLSITNNGDETDYALVFNESLYGEIMSYTALSNPIDLQFLSGCSELEVHPPLPEQFKKDISIPESKELVRILIFSTNLYNQQDICVC